MASQPASGGGGMEVKVSNPAQQNGINKNNNNLWAAANSATLTPFTKRLEQQNNTYLLGNL